jgi:hypothetical protein
LRVRNDLCRIHSLLPGSLRASFQSSLPDFHTRSPSIFRSSPLLCLCFSLSHAPVKRCKATVSINREDLHDSRSTPLDLTDRYSSPTSPSSRAQLKGCYRHLGRQTGKKKIVQLSPAWSFSRSIQIDFFKSGVLTRFSAIHGRGDEPRGTTRAENGAFPIHGSSHSEPELSSKFCTIVKVVLRWPQDNNCHFEPNGKACGPAHIQILLKF